MTSEKAQETLTKQTVADFPLLKKQWHPTKNGALQPEDVPHKSLKKVWWKCEHGEDHEWETRVHDRMRGSQCGFCINQRLSITNSLKTLHPLLAKEWHPTKNEGLTPEKVIGTGYKKYWWICLENPSHDWEASVTSRIREDGSYRSCPVCRATPLSITHPEIAAQWHPSKNLPLKPQDFIAGSPQRAWWKCEKGPDHEWETKIVERLKTGCPHCDGKKLSITNSLEVRYPSLAKEWHPTKNGELKPNKVFGGGKRKYWWKCEKGDDHEWEASVQKRAAGQGCSICRGLTVVNSNCLASTHPELVPQWHPTKNTNLTPYDVIAGNSTPVWWICLKDSEHEWSTSCKNRTKPGRDTTRGCPYCSNQKVSKSNSLAVTNPALAAEWHPTKNGILTAQDVVEKSGIKIWWLCQKDISHEWRTSPARRVYGTGCPICNGGTTVEALRNFVKSLINHIESFTPAERYMIFQQAGILKCAGRAKDLIKAITAGRFPHEELEKFVAGQDSLADQFINGEINSYEALSESLDCDDIDQITINLEETTLEALLDTQSKLPTINTSQSLESIDRAVQLVSMDNEAIEFLLASKTTQLWQHAFQNKVQAREQAQAFCGTEYSERVKNRFLADLDAAENLELPQNYSFRVKGKLAQPNLMQLLIASQLKQRTGLGNWSGTGTGKTLSAILASRAINARLTIVCCPNPVVGSSKTGRGWADEIVSIFPESKVQIKTLSPEWQAQDVHKYLIINYEQLQKPDASGLIHKLIDQSSIDMIIIDEIHYAKQRKKENLSLRRELLTTLITLARKQNPNLRVLGLSATPIINNLQEGKSLLEMITGVQYPELETKATIPNCHKLHQQLVIHGYRWRHNYAQEFLEKRVEIDCSQYVDKIRALGKKAPPHDIDELLTEARLPTIRENCLPGKKTLIYTHYVEGITEKLASALRADGHVVGFYTGEDKTGLEPFLKGNVNVLIGSSAIATGIDGLQNVCDQLIVNILPWTSSEYEQLTGRIARQGQQSSSVTIVLPITYANINGIRWSWEESKLSRIKWKKDVASAAVDGVIPEGHLQTPEQTTKHLLDWLERLSTGSVNMIERSPILAAPLVDNPSEETQRLVQYGDLSKLNQLWNVSLSTTTHTRLKENPEEWHHYHYLYRSSRESWTVIPYEEMIHWCRERTGFNYKIGDFGCGEAKLAEAINGTHTIYSFDHIAINTNVTACDMTHVPLEDEILDVALFSLSLMGKNFPDYLKEAHRTLRLDGILIIFEPTSRFIDDQGINHSSQFAKDLEQFGFSGGTVETIGLFTRIQAIKRFKVLIHNSPTISLKG
jgi:superfamily II DNA or RNA helicase